MRVIVAGVGTMGERLIHDLNSAGGHEVVAIDSDEERCDYLTEHYDALVIHGDATDPEILDKAQIDEADGLVAASGYDPINAIVAMVAHRQKVERIVVRLASGSLRAALDELEITEIIEPAAAAAARAMMALHGSSQSDLSQLVRGGLRLGELPVRAAGDGSRIADLDLGEECVAVALLRGDGARVATSDQVLQEGDVLIVVAEAEAALERARDSMPS